MIPLGLFFFLVAVFAELNFPQPHEEYNDLSDAIALLGGGGLALMVFGLLQALWGLIP